MARKRKPVADWVLYCVARVLFFGLRITPQFLCYPALDMLGRIFFVVGRRRRRIAIENVTLALGATRAESEIKRIAAAACGNAFMVIADIAKAPSIVHGGRFFDLVADWDAELFLGPARKLAPGKPPILCSAHLGSWEACGHLAAATWDSVHIIARPLGNKRVDAYVRRSRALSGQHLHPRRGGLRRLIAALKNGEAVVALPDQNQRIRGIFVPFFGKLASCDRSIAWMGQLTGSPIVVGAALRVGRRFRFRFVLSDVFTVPAGGKDPIYAATLRLNRAIERLILEAPEQYFWVHNRWRTRPEEPSKAA